MFESAPLANKHYYAFTLLVGDSGMVEYRCQTYWVGYTDDEPPREIRRARLIDANLFLEAWRKLERPGMVVNREEDLVSYFAFGGNAVVESELAESTLAEWLSPRLSVNVGEYGFAAPTLLPRGSFQRAPTPKCRMKVLKRDRYKCRVCGRSPSNHVDVELHVHHIRPWAAGGVSEISNLITLCHTCHRGLDPHYDHSLFKLLPAAPSDERCVAYRSQLAVYQEMIAQRLADPDV